MTNHSGRTPHFHWRFLYARRRNRRLAKDFKEIIMGQGISVIGAIAAGYFLELTKVQLISVMGVFMLLPGVFELGGAVAGAFGAKLNHIYEKHPDIARRVYFPQMIYSLCIAVVGSLILGLVGGVAAWLIFEGDMSLILKISMLSVALSSLVGLPIVGWATIRAIKAGLDADNIIGPVETSLFDALSVLSVFISVGLLT